MLLMLLLLCRYVMREEDVQAAVSSALRLVNMQDHMFRATHTLSGGQRQRVAIAGMWVARHCSSRTVQSFRASHGAVRVS